MDQNVSKKEIIDVSGEGQGRSLPQWFGQMFLGRKKNRPNQGDERYLSVGISDLDSSSDPLPYDGRNHPEFDLPLVSPVDEGEESNSTENIERASSSQSDAKKKQQKLLEEFALLSGIELSPKSVADLRDRVEKQLETESLSSPPLALVEGVEHSEATESAPDLEEQSSGRVHDAYTLLVENEKKQKTVQSDEVQSIELSDHQEEVASSAAAEPDESIVNLDASSDVVSEKVSEYRVEPKLKLEDGAPSEKLVSEPVYDQKAVDSILSELRKINSIHLIVVVGVDGSILASDNLDQLRESVSGALVFKSVKHFKRLGQQSGLGSLAQSVIEFSDGKIIVENLGDSALFIAVDRSAILGLIRSQTKSQVERLKAILN